MPVSQPIYTGYLKWVLLIIAISFMVSCSIKDDLSDCPPFEVTPAIQRQLLYVAVSEETVKSTGIEIDDIMVYLFDQNSILIDTIPYTMDMINNNIPIDLTEKDMKGAYATVWANMSDYVVNDDVVMGNMMSRMMVEMQPNIERTDFFSCLGDMFFGNVKIDFKRVSDELATDTVVITRKNAKLNITVRGLPSGSVADDYYYEIHSIYSEYNYYGAPQLLNREIYETGSIAANGDFISPEPYIMFHHANNHVYNDHSCLSINFYKNNSNVVRAADTLVATVNKDEFNSYIALESNKTTNVLIVLGENYEDIEVKVVITGWDEIYQWNNW